MWGKNGGVKNISVTITTFRKKYTSRAERHANAAVPRALAIDRKSGAWLAAEQGSAQAEKKPLTCSEFGTNINYMEGSNRAAPALGERP